MKNSGGIFKNIAKYVLAIIVVLATIFGLTNSKSIMSFVKEYFSVGQVPAHEKKITNNGNGTYNLSLSVTGEAEKQITKVNVIVIVDRSNSMNEQSGTGAYVASNSNNNVFGLVDGEFVSLTRSGTTYWYRPEGATEDVQYTGQRYTYDSTATRMQATKAAVDSLANSLLGHNGKDGNPNDTVQMALVQFGTRASTRLDPTNSATDFISSVNGITIPEDNNDEYGGATNWEAALSQANTINFGDSDPTYVIFFSDGAPTVRNSSLGYTDTYGHNYNGIYGTGGERDRWGNLDTENMNRAYSAATDDAQTLANNVGADRFYTIFAYGASHGATYMSNLTSAAGAPAGNNYSASSSSELKEAFDSILSDIEMAGIGSVSIDDGTTSNVQTSTGIAELLKVDTNSYKYYRNGVEWKSTDTPAPPAATFENGHVKWDLSDLGVLENGVKYEVRFDVYPSQTTYDIIADLKNGEITYNSLDSEIKKYIVDNGGGSYSLRTNTTATLSYDDTRDEAGVQTKEYINPDPVGTNADTIAVEKIWENDIDSRKDRPVQLELKRDGEKMFDVSLDGTIDDPLALEPAPGSEVEPWKAEGIFIATGLAKTVNGNLVVLDAGHDYTFGELGSEAYNWELESITVHPMLIDGVLTELTLVEDSTSCPDGETCYTVNEKLYKVSGTNPTITATNYRRSNINITKTVDGQSADPDQEFEFTIKIDQKDENNQTIPSVDTTNHNDYLWFSVQDSEGNWVDYGNAINGWVRYQGTDAPTGKTTYYYYAPNGSTAVVNLKAGYNVRYTNLVSNTDFTVSEKTVDNYVLKSITSNDDNTAADKINLNTKTINGKILNNNESYNVEFKNVYELVNVIVDKVWDDTTGDGIIPESIDVTLLANGQPATVDNATVTLTGEDNWTYTWTGLDRFKNNSEITYDVQEINDSYVLAHYTSSKEYAKVENEEGEETEDKQHVIITNTRIPEDTVTKASVFKIWDDDRNHDGFRPTSLQVQLNDEDETVVTLNSSNEWKATVEDLPKYANGQEVTYTWTELNLPSEYTQQTPVVTNIEEDGEVVGKLTTITNKHESVYINIPVEKAWTEDDGGTEGLRIPITVELLKVTASGNVSMGTKTLNSANDWKAVFEHLAQYENGQEIEYTLAELTQVPHYKKPVISKDGNKIIVTNEREDDKTIDIPVEKIWVGDNNDEQGLRTPITVTLKNGNTTVGTKTLSATNNWKDKFTDLPKYENGAEIEYTLTENYTNPHYEIGDVQGNTKEGFTITNVRDEDDITIKYTVKKIWDDSDDQDGIRPDSITVTLTGTVKERDNNGNLTDTDKVAYPAEEVTVSRPEGAATNEWSVTVENLPKYADGQLITYTISEEQVDEYDEPEIDGNEVTNPHNPFETSVTVIKKWDDKNNQDGLRDEVTFKLIDENGLLIPNDMGDTTFRLTDENADSEGNWVVTKTGLPRRAAGKDIEYSVIEIQRPAGYTAKIGEPEEGEVDKTKEDDQSGDQEFTITYTNVHETATVDVEGVKEWNDDSNRDVVRPQSIYVTLTGTVDGEVVFGPETKLVTSATAVDGNPNQWAYSFTGLDRYYNGGNEITYTITETDADGNEIEKLPNYEAPEYFDDYSVRNTHTNEPTSLSGKKVWEDDGNRDAVRPTTITIEVYDVDDPNTIVASKEVTGSMTGAEWSYEFTGLNKNKNVNGTKTPITYKVKEVVVPDGYTSVVSNDGKTITNTYTPEKTQISGKKVWVDDGNRDALRPTTITIEVYDVDDPNTVVASKEVSGDMTADDWSYTITGLPANKNVNGKATPITYKVKEVVVPDGYTSKVSDDGKTITNTHETDKINVPVSKTWIDSDDKEKHRPTEITVYLYDDQNVKVGETTLNAGNGWEYTFENLPANRNVNGVATPIVYRAEEVITDQIREFYDVDVVENTAIINTIKDLSKDIPVAKIWNDANNQDGKRKPVTITLSGTITDKDGNVINVETDKVPKTITLTEEDLDPNDSNRWAGVFENVPIFYQGSWITYQITEGDVADYSVTAYGTEDDGTLTVTNTHEPEKAVYSASKVWNDDDDNDDRRPDSVTFALMANGSEVQRLVASEENGWKVTFNAVPVYKEGAVGQKITYTVTEPELDSNYTMSEDIATGETEYDFIITNDHEPMTITYNVQKIWDDWDNQSGDRPESITVRIYESTDLENEVASQVITEASGWSCTFEGLPKYRNKQLIQYVITEDNVDLYKEPIITQVEQERDTTELNNTVTNPKDRVPYNDTGEITVNKYWKDEENKYKKRPKSVTIELLADGEVIATADLTEANDWTYTFTGLWKYKEGEVGVEIVYSIRELPVEYYKTTIDGFDVYNTYDGPVPEITPPPTGVMMVKDNNNNVLFEMIATVLATSYTIVVARRRNEQE